MWECLFPHLGFNSPSFWPSQEASFGHQGRSWTWWSEGPHHTSWILRPHSCPGPWWRLRRLLWLLWRRWRGGRGQRLLLRWGRLRQRGVVTCFFDSIPNLSNTSNPCFSFSGLLAILFLGYRVFPSLGNLFWRQKSMHPCGKVRPFEICTSTKVTLFLAVIFHHLKP